jgi:transposase
MARKLDISKSEMLRMREEGLSNRDIAKCLDIHYATVYNWIGPQGGRMENLAAFDEPKPKAVETPKEEQKTAPRAVDSLEMICETVRSANGTYQAEIEYELEVVKLLGSTISFGGLAELATFIIGLASRVEQKGAEK